MAKIIEQEKTTEMLFIENFLKCTADAARDISVDPIEGAIDLLFDAWEKRSKIIIIGNGGSAATASHFACDLNQSIVGEAPRFRVISFADNVSLITGYANDNGLGSIFVEQMKAWIEPGDVLVAISVHGRTGDGKTGGSCSPNIVQAVRYAKSRGARLLGFCGFDDGAMKKMCDVSIIVPHSHSVIGMPLAEGFHALIHHLLSAALREKIARFQNRSVL